MNIRSTAIFLIALCTTITFSQNTTKEAGKYERKSVTYINALYLMDPTVRNLPPEKVGFTLDKMKEGIMMRRFDYNPVPQSFISDFVNRVNNLTFEVPSAENSRSAAAALSSMGTLSQNDPMLDSITKIMEETVVPKILEVVDIEKEARAANLTTEEQRNSFIADKAKTSGITMEDVEKVRNSAYVFIPLIRRYHSVVRDSMVTTGFDAGIIWFRISTKGDKAQAIPVVKKFTYSMGSATRHRVYATEKGPMNAQEFAFYAAIKNAVRNLVVATQEIPDFRLGGQVLDASFMGVGFDLGRKEGLHVGDKYRIVEFTEEADGKITQKNNGWVIVNSVADTNSRQGYKSHAQIISGSPYTGSVLSEYPRIPIDILIKGRMFAYTLDMKDTTIGPLSKIKLNDGYGFGIDAHYNLGRDIGINQFYFGLAFGMGFGSASGTIRTDSASSGSWDDSANVNGVQNISAEVSLVQKLYFRRLALVLQPYFGFQMVDVKSDKGSGNDYYAMDNYALGFGGNVGIEFALSPSVNFGVGAGYQLYGKSSSWDLSKKNGTDGKLEFVKTYDNSAELDRSGLTAQVYITWSPPALAFDPGDMVRGTLGL